MLTQPVIYRVQKVRANHKNMQRVTADLRVSPLNSGMSCYRDIFHEWFGHDR